MNLGLGPRTAATGVGAFLQKHVEAVAGAIPALGLLASIQLAYVTGAQPRYIRARVYSGGDNAQEWGRFVTSLDRISEIVSGVYIHTSLQVAVRGEQQDTQWAIVPALISLTPDIRDLAHYAEAPETLRVWRALFDCDAASAFRRDNSSVLRAVRERWRLDLLERTSRRKRNTMEEDIGIVTLSDPPETTPETNEHLYRINYPRLTRMIALWEQAAHCVFESVDSNPSL